MLTPSQVQKDIRITHLNHWLIKLINKYIHYRSNVFSTFFVFYWNQQLKEFNIKTPALDTRMAKSGSKPQSPKPNLFTVSYPVMWWCTIKLIWVAKVSVFLKVFLCWLLFWYPFHPRDTAVACKRPRSFCQKCRWQVTAKHAYNLRLWLCMKWHGLWMYGVHGTHRDNNNNKPLSCAHQRPERSHDTC